MKITEIHMKIIAVGLIPIFLVLSSILPDTTGKTLLLGGILVTVLVVAYLGMSMHRKEAQEPDDLLAVPPKKS
jgi:hypothetical protein